MVMATAIFCALRQGDLKGAKETAESQLTISRPLGGSTYAAGLSGLAVVLAEDGEVERSRDLFAEAIDVARRDGRPSVLAAALFNLGDLEQAQGDFERALDLSRDALEAFRLADDAQGEAHALIAIGRCSLHVGRLDEGREHASEGLRRVHELGIPGITAVGLLSLAEVARLEADWTRAATLLGAEEAILEHTGEVREHAEETLHHRLETECRAVLGDMRFDVAVALGAEMTLAEAVEYALASID